MDSRWSDVDDYLRERLRPSDPHLEAALTAAADAGLPPIQVSALQGAFLRLLVRAVGATRVLEVGTLGGYSTLWLAGGVPADGTVVTIELEPDRAEVARATIEAAGLGDRVEILVGAALERLPELRDRPPFDLVFIDADKTNNAAYVSWAVELGRPGTVIVVDNVVRNGAVAEPASTDAAVLGVQRMLDEIAADPRLDATALQTVGDKGYDGFLLALVR